MQPSLHSGFFRGAANPVQVPVVPGKRNPGALLWLPWEGCRTCSGTELGIPGAAAAAGASTGPESGVSSSHPGKVPEAASRGWEGIGGCDP